MGSILANANLGVDGRSSKDPARQSPQSPPVTHPISPTPNQDSTPPEVTSFHQEGLERIVVKFSEPVQRIDKITYDPGLETPTWDENRTTLTVTVDQNKLEKGKPTALRLAGLVDNANVRNPREVAIRLDAQAPLLHGIEIVDAHTALLILDEDPKISNQSTVTLNASLTGTLSASPSSEKQLIVQIPGVDLRARDSHQLVVEWHQTKVIIMQALNIQICCVCKL
ncbi:MAG TPA: hypothetical protein VE954_24740 [Oligoflexus sp.]|uniref:hypothetical protein n=1 Tax=Oligoflexus sp. TaxID=1971216 RepID=UPI002D67FF76|nr:hypothetical protein [Oligoflexus sp.]HYX36325.1 hypothetical protein [Oligoflexus sp.]